MTRITVIEDNPDNRLLLHALLEDSYIITEYENGLIALEGMKQDRPDLILLDISLPELDGIRVLQRIREQSDLKNVPVIALTAHAMVGDRERFLESGFDGYVMKPIVDENILFEEIHRLLAE